MKPFSLALLCLLLVSGCRKISGSDYSSGYTCTIKATRIGSLVAVRGFTESDVDAIVVSYYDTGGHLTSPVTYDLYPSGRQGDTLFLADSISTTIFTEDSYKVTLLPVGKTYYLTNFTGFAKDQTYKQDTANCPVRTVSSTATTVGINDTATSTIQLQGESRSYVLLRSR